MLLLLLLLSSLSLSLSLMSSLLLLLLVLLLLLLVVVAVVVIVVLVVVVFVLVCSQSLHIVHLVPLGQDTKILYKYPPKAIKLTLKSDRQLQTHGGLFILGQNFNGMQLNKLSRQVTVVLP